MTTFRLFASARAAAGLRLFETDAQTLGQAVDALSAEVRPGDADRWRDVAARCSYLVDGISTQDRDTSLAGVDLVDVMPPFAGG